MIVSPLTNRSILVTGGTGSFGKAFVRHALNAGARQVRVFSRDELKQSEMAASFCDERLRFLIGSVTDADRVARAIRGVDLVVHAAAMKQVPACEVNPWEAIETNTIGARIVAGAAIDAGVMRGIFLSTDKAAAPNTLYGSSKLSAERLWNAANVYAAGTPTRLAATRYGNVINSRGSVIPIFREQHARGQALTITDNRCTRFWMTLQHAVELVELAIGQARGGEVFIPKAGSASVVDVAHAAVDHPIRIFDHIGLRRGEKMHETLISEDEARDTFDLVDHYRIEPERTWELLAPLAAKRVPEGWSYRSDTNNWQLTIDELREMIG